MPPLPACSQCVRRATPQSHDLAFSAAESSSPCAASPKGTSPSTKRTRGTKARRASPEGGITCLRHLPGGGRELRVRQRPGGEDLGDPGPNDPPHMIEAKSGGGVLLVSPGASHGSLRLVGLIRQESPVPETLIEAE